MSPPTVRTETAEYRGYELRVIEWLGTWQASICPLRETLPFPPSSEELPTAPPRMRRLLKRGSGSTG